MKKHVQLGYSGLNITFIVYHEKNRGITYAVDFYIIYHTIKWIRYNTTRRQEH